MHFTDYQVVASYCDHPRSLRLIDMLSTISCLLSQLFISSSFFGVMCYIDLHCVLFAVFRVESSVELPALSASRSYA